MAYLKATLMSQEGGLLWNFRLQWTLFYSVPICGGHGLLASDFRRPPNCSFVSSLFLLNRQVAQLTWAHFLGSRVLASIHLIFSHMLIGSLMLTRF